MTTPNRLIAQWRTLSDEQYQMASDFDAKHDGANAHTCMGRGRIYYECANDLAAAGLPSVDAALLVQERDEEHANYLVENELRLTGEAKIRELEVTWAAASKFIRSVIDSLGREQPSPKGIVNLVDLGLQVTGQIEELKAELITAGPPPTVETKPIAWKAVYACHGTIINSLHSSQREAMTVLDEKRGSEYSAHELIALCKVPPFVTAEATPLTERSRLLEQMEKLEVVSAVGTLGREDMVSLRKVMEVLEGRHDARTKAV